MNIPLESKSVDGNPVTQPFLFASGIYVDEMFTILALTWAKTNINPSKFPSLMAGCRM